MLYHHACVSFSSSSCNHVHTSDPFVCVVCTPPHMFAPDQSTFICLVVYLLLAVLLSYVHAFECMFGPTLFDRLRVSIQVVGSVVLCIAPCKCCKLSSSALVQSFVLGNKSRHYHSCHSSEQRGISHSHFTPPIIYCSLLALKRMTHWARLATCSRELWSIVRLYRCLQRQTARHSLSPACACGI